MIRNDIQFEDTGIKVFKTTRYDIFKLMDKGNREPTHWRRIMESMKKKLLLTIIYVNENYEIIDGQNRFLALKELGKPIYFVVLHGYGYKEVSIYNTESKNWCTMDYIRAYSELGYDGYRELYNFCREYSELPNQVLYALAQMNNKVYCNGASIKNGTFNLGDIHKARKIANMIKDFSEFGNIYKKREFGRAIIALSGMPEYNHEHMLAKVRLQPRNLVSCLTIKEYVSMFEEIYNYKSKIKTHFIVD